MPEAGAWIFLSYAGDDGFEASLLQYAVEHLLDDLHAKVWTYQRDQAHDQKAIAAKIIEPDPAIACVDLPGFAKDPRLQPDPVYGTGLCRRVRYPHIRAAEPPDLRRIAGRERAALAVAVAVQ